MKNLSFSKFFLIYNFLVLSLSFADIEPIEEVWEPSGNYPASEFVKVGMVAVSPSGVAPLTQDRERAERYKQRNRRNLESYIRIAAQSGAEIIITPEFGVVGYPDQPDLPDAEDNFRNAQEVAPYAEDSDGPSFQFFSELSRELGIYIHYGLVLRGNGNNTFHNAVQVVGPSGELEVEYYKISLFELEHNFLVSGRRGATYESPAGVIGIIICADVYSWSALNWYRSGVDALALSTSWARYNSGMNTFRSTARRMGLYIAAANQTYFPDSGMVNPDGTNQSHIRQSSGVVYGYLPRQ